MSDTGTFAWQHTVDVVLVDDTGTGDRMGRNQTKLAVALAVICRVYDQPTKLVMIGDREVTVHPFLLHFPANPRLTTAHQLVWQDPESGLVSWLAVKGTDRSPDNGLWCPWIAYCELDESAEPPLSSTAGLSPYTPP